MSVKLAVQLFLVSPWLSLVSTIEIDNKLVGTPTVDCRSDSISVSFTTTNPFTGRVYVRGGHDTVGCYQDSSQQPPASATNPTLNVGLTGQCGIVRQRNAGMGMVMSVTVVISFHRTFVTKVDRAFRIECHYTPTAGATVTQRLEISTLRTEVYTPPQTQTTCTYDITNNDPTYGTVGAKIRYAQIGQKVLHKWMCLGMDGARCMRVHTCTVFDGENKTVTLIDANGCSNDRYALQTPRMVSSSHYQVEAHVFKFADRPVLEFSCVVQLLPRTGTQGCPLLDCAAEARPLNSSLVKREARFVPRVLNDAQNRTWQRATDPSTHLSYGDTSTAHANDPEADAQMVDLSQEIFVLDLDADTSSSDARDNRNSDARPSRLTSFPGGLLADDAPRRDTGAYCLTTRAYQTLVTCAGLLAATVCVAVLCVVLWRCGGASPLRARYLMDI